MSNRRSSPALRSGDAVLRGEGAADPGEATNENGDVEQRHHRFKRAVEQALLLRGSRDFGSVADYEDFLKGLFARLNAGRGRAWQKRWR